MVRTGTAGGGTSRLTKTTRLGTRRRQFGMGNKTVGIVGLYQLIMYIHHHKSHTQEPLYNTNSAVGSAAAHAETQQISTSLI